jgi:hypothetical protein
MANADWIIELGRRPRRGPDRPRGHTPPSSSPPAPPSPASTRLADTAASTSSASMSSATSARRSPLRAAIPDPDRARGEGQRRVGQEPPLQRMGHRHPRPPPRRRHRRPRHFQRPHPRDRHSQLPPPHHSHRDPAKLEHLPQPITGGQIRRAPWGQLGLTHPHRSSASAIAGRPEAASNPNTAACSGAASRSTTAPLP